MIRTFKRKFKPTQAREECIANWIGACRVVYNLGLEINITAWKTCAQSISAFELMKQLPDLKKDYPRIKDVPSQSLQAVLERLDLSNMMFFKGGGFPRWASKKRYRSLHLKSIKIDAYNVILPKIGKVRMYKNAPIEGIPRTAQIII